MLIIFLSILMNSDIMWLNCRLLCLPLPLLSCQLTTVVQTYSTFFFFFSLVYLRTPPSVQSKRQTLWIIPIRLL